MALRSPLVVCMNKFLLLILFAAPLAAQEPRFFIERIEVRNARRVTPDVVVAESRLREGHEYSEAELRDAATRLERLPFLLSVDFSLEKGGERGRHVLVLTITETKPFFFFLDARPFFESGDEYLEIDYSDRFGAEGNAMALGFRWFVGRRGAVHIGLTSTEDDREFTEDDGGLAVGYTQYDLFGTRAFATLNLKRPITGDWQGPQIAPQLVVGIPVSPNQTVTLQYDETRFSRERRIVMLPDELPIDYRNRSTQRLVSARWSYNTTNEPVLPTRGTLLHVTPSVGRLRWTRTALANPPFDLVTTGTTYGVEAGAARYWELSDRNSVFADARGGWERIERSANLEGVDDSDGTATYGSAGVGISRSLWSRERQARGGDSRFDLTLRYANRSQRFEIDPPELPSRERDVRQVSTSWIRRTSWGTFRLGVGYAW
jgi:outer membrane protein assembly factor BamA